MTDQQQTQPNYREDEIDLRKLFQAIGNFFRNIGRGFINMIIGIRRATIRFRILLLIMIIIGSIAGVVYTKTTKLYYQTSMIISSEYFNAQLVENAISKLNVLCTEPGRDGLARVLNLDATDAKLVSHFEFEPFVSDQDVLDIEILKQKLQSLSVKDQDIKQIVDQIDIHNKKSYVIKVNVFNTSIIKNLQPGLVAYFKDNPYILNRINATRKNTISLISKLERDVTRLDSLTEAFNLNLKTMAKRPNESSNNVYVGENGLMNPTDVYNQGVYLYSRLLNAREKLELGSDFEVIDGFTVFSQPENPSSIRAGWYGLVAGLGLGYLLIILIVINKYLNRVERTGFTQTSTAE